MISLFWIHFSSYWLFCKFFYSYDRKFIDKSINNKNKYYKAIKVSLLNQIFITLPIFYLLQNYINNAIIRSQNDTLIIIFIKLLFMLNISNLLFYISHRILHIKNIFKYIHSKHHEFINPVAPASLYAHPIEHIICNNLIFLLPYIYFGFPLIITYMIIIFGTLLTTLSHVEYKFKYLDIDHIYHHKYYKYNFGFGGGYIDKLFNTYFTINE